MTVQPLASALRAVPPARRADAMFIKVIILHVQMILVVVVRV